MKAATAFRGLQLIAGVVVINRLRHGARRLPPLTAGPMRTSSVSVVIPARNEATRLPNCLRALAEHGHVDEVLVVDDESTDGTAQVANDLGATVITGSPLPDGWVGKPWALHQGLKTATGDWIVFLDADTVPLPGLVNAIISIPDADLVSLSARFRSPSFAQAMLHSSMLATFVYRFGPVGRRDPLPANRTVMNGQCFAVRRDWLIQRGGFAPIRSIMTDDIALVRSLASRGAAIKFLDGSELIEVNMYTTVTETWREWGRSLPMSDASPGTTQWFDLVVLWLTIALPLPMVLLRRANAVDKALCVVRLAMCVPLSAVYKPRSWAALLSVFSDAAAIARLTQTTLRPVRRWRDREYGQTET